MTLRLKKVVLRVLVSFFGFFASHFVASRLQQFLLDTGWASLGDGAFWAITSVLSIVIILFSDTILKYFEDYRINTLADGLFIIASALFVYSCYGIVVTQTCYPHNSFLCTIGAVVFLYAYLHILCGSGYVVLKKLFSVRISKKDVVFLCMLFAVLNVLAITFCLIMKKIFVWDNAGYFKTVLGLDSIFPSAQYFSTVYRSVFETDYNYIIALPASIMCKLFGRSRLVFVLSIVNFYLFPLCVTIYGFACYVFKLSRIKCVGVFLALPMLIFCAHNGFIDVGGATVTFGATVIFLYFRDERAGALTGTLLALSILLRRWFSIYALSFVVVAVLCETITFFSSIIFKKSKRIPLRAVHTAIFSGATLFFFAQKLVSGRLLADYGNLYSAYSLGLRYDVLLFTRYFGIALCLVLVAYTIVLQTTRIKSGILPETFVLVVGCMTFYVLTRIQTHGQQHLLLYVPVFAILGASLLDKLKAKAAAIFALGFCALQTANTFVPREQPKAILEIQHPTVIPNFTNLPPVEQNTAEILDMVAYLDKNIGEKGKTLCFLSSSIPFNSDTLNNAEISLSVKKESDIDRSSYLLAISNVDSRDGLSKNLFISDYLLVPSQLQIHLNESDQEVISVPYRMVINKEGFGEAYEKTPNVFIMENGLEFYLYERIREVTNEEIQKVKNEIFG